MASPQLENGFTRIANETLDAVAAAKLNGTQCAIVLCVWRQTYGYQRKSHAISESFLSGATGVSARNIRRELTALIKANILITVKEPSFRNSRVIAFNKNYSEWQNSPQRINISREDNSAPSPPDESIPSREDEYILQIKKKEKIKKDMCNSYSNELFDRFWSVYPRRQAKQDAAKAFAKLKPDEQLLDAIINAVKRKSASDEWQRNNGQFIPLPATYLNGRRWEDESMNINQTDEPKLIF